MVFDDNKMAGPASTTTIFHGMKNPKRVKTPKPTAPDETKSKASNKNQEAILMEVLVHPEGNNELNPIETEMKVFTKQIVEAKLDNRMDVITASLRMDVACQSLDQTSIPYKE